MVMGPDADDCRRMLTRGLVGPHIELYQRSAWFKSAIDVLAEQMLPSMVDGMAMAAEKKERDRVVDYNELMTRPHPLRIEDALGWIEDTTPDPKN